MAVPVLIELLDDKDAGYGRWTLEAIGPRPKLPFLPSTDCLRMRIFATRPPRPWGRSARRPGLAVPAHRTAQGGGGRQFVALALEDRSGRGGGCRPYGCLR